MPDNKNLKNVDFTTDINYKYPIDKKDYSKSLKGTDFISSPGQIDIAQRNRHQTR